LARQKGIDLSGVPGSGPGGRVVAWNVAEAAQALSVLPAQAALVTPVAQRLAQDLGVDLASVEGSGPGGRITRQDVERSALAKEAGPPAAVPQAVSAQIPQAPVQPLSRFQKIMAERMASSFRDAPHFYLHVEADARPLLALRQALLPKLEAGQGVHLTVTDLLIKFCALALVRHPGVIAQWAAGGLFQPQQINIGVAADTPNGLVVPVIRQCDQLGLSEIARQRTALVEKARLGKLAPEDLELGVFTLTNLGAFNIDFFDAVLNPPQAAILAVGRIKERALVENGQVVAASTLQLSLSIDHRVLDGAAAARFLSDLVELIETPGLALG
jgi:pyruvate dehydrogenase E2 component (dihydrolipoamide acetyltransferase)